jgi:hypothetical protein
MEFEIKVVVAGIRKDVRNDYARDGEVFRHIEVDVSAEIQVERKDRSRQKHQSGLMHARFTDETTMDEDLAVEEAVLIAVERVICSIRENNEFGRLA